MHPEDLGVVPIEQPQELPPRIPEWRRFFRTHPSLRRWLGIVGVSLATSLVVVAVACVVGWKHRAQIAALLVSTLPSEAPTPLIIDDTLSEAPLAPLEEGGKDLTVTEVVAKVNPSVVSIEVSTGSGIFSKIVSRGTGFFATSNGYIVTNRHVVDTVNATFSVTASSGKKYAATLVAKDPVYDLAVLKVAGSDFPAAVLGDSDNLVLGQSVVAIGFALGKFENSISVGVVSGLGRSIVASGGGSSEQLDEVIQTDAAINSGNSGGPLINLKGEVVGVNVAMARGSQSIGFAIPSDSVAQVVNSVKAYGFIVRPYVGVSYVPINADVQQQLDLSVDYGVFVESLIDDAPAARAGIRERDVILSIDGTKLDGDPSFATIIRNKKVGQNVSMVILRKGIQSTIKVTLAQAPDL